ncbi:cytochrome c oxidase subunit II [Oxalobacteraceae bacterium R-40]|uniref:Cytochrome aa3 subunit 2 n=1 Tax=Keguizhuia sedimenti TaxID=3064264 RepID=A0ABU1BT95_9BURK|nr:cytochrome c oxidase subunit II [Oxalobacteraceae bacterium R-40]
MPLLILFILSCLPVLSHAGMQSVFDPKGIDAEQILNLSWVMFIGGGIIFILVMLLVLLALFGPAGMRTSLSKRGWIIGGGIVFPVVVLTGLLVYSLIAANRMVQTEKPPAARIEITGELWWWRVRYLDSRGHTIFETANEIRIPSGRPVDLLLKSSNVIHSFWVPNLGGKIDMLPGHTNRQRVQATQTGVFRGQCAEFCGAQHAKMALYVVAQTPEEYERWFAARLQPPPEPDEAMLRLGKRLFLDNRCGLCHAVRGTEAKGALGPDLSDVGGRQSLGAGILPNKRGAIAGWITDSQQIKPGNKMPAFNQFSGEELRALSAYLESLK